jgi:hypothetical protein
VAGHHRRPARLMDDHLSLERTYEQVMKARPTLKATIKAVRQAVRDRGVSALYEIETRKRLAEMGIYIVSPDMNDPLNPPPPSEHEHTTHHGPFTKVDEALIAQLIRHHPEAEKEEIRSVVQRFMELDTEDSWCLALAEHLMQSGSQWLLEEAAEQFKAEWGTKVAERWRREIRRDKRRETRVERDRNMIDQLAKDLEAQGVSACRTKAKELWASRQNVSPSALKQRRRRARQKRICPRCNKARA